MHFTWLGSTAIKIQTKYQEKDVVIVIDPYKPEAGTSPRSLTPDIALYTHGEKDSITLSGEPFILSTPGECETQGVLITAIEGHEPGTTMYRLDAEGMSVGHLGNTVKPLTNRQMEVLNGVDVLLVIGNADAVKLINEIEPRVVIPMAFQSDNDPKATPVEPFLKEMGAGSLTPETKIIIKKKELPEEETKVFLLKKE